MSIKKHLRLLWEPNLETFRIISIEGYFKIWSSQPTAFLNSAHPLKEFSDENSLDIAVKIFSTYNCMENLNLDNFDGEFYCIRTTFFL